MTNRYSLEFKERAVRLVSAGQQEHGSEWSAMLSVAAKLGCSPETLRRWVRPGAWRQAGGYGVRRVQSVAGTGEGGSGVAPCE